MRSNTITHSLCTLEFEAHRPLYDWLVENGQRPVASAADRFARLNLTYTVMSKRRLLDVVQRATSPAGTTRACPPSSACGVRGYSRNALRNFCERIGVAKREKPESDMALRNTPSART